MDEEDGEFTRHSELNTARDQLRYSYCAPNCLPSTSTTVTDPTTRPQVPPRNFSEHTYSKKSKRSGDNSIDDAYIETINLLKEINNTLDTRLMDISKDLKTIAKKTRKEYITSVAFVPKDSSFVFL